MTAGLAGAGEAADADKVLKGDLGATACDTAYAGETVDVRRAQLRLAKAVHRIEANRYDEAIAEARALADAAPKKPAPGFKRGFVLSAMEIEAYARIRQGNTAGAAALGLKMYETAPYDLINVLRAARLVSLAPEPSDATQAFWDAATRLYPDSLVSRADADEWAGDYAAAAADLQAYYDIVMGFLKDRDEVLLPDILATVALNRALAGDQAESGAAANAARKAIDEAVRTNRVADAASRAQELLDLQTIALLAAEGKLAEARRAFAARSRWLAPTAPLAAELTHRLRDGAAPADLFGALSQDPARLRAEGRSARARSIAEDKNVGRYLLNGRRMVADDDAVSAGGGLSRRVWNTQKSFYRQKPRDKDKFVGALFIDYSYAPNLLTTTRAFSLHAALLAKAEGKTRFVFMPSSRKTDSVIVRFGSPGDPNMPDSASNDVDAVIAALSPLIPAPPPKT